MQRILNHMCERFNDVLQLEPKRCQEWYVTASKGDYHELLRLAKDEPRFVNLRVSDVLFIRDANVDSFILHFPISYLMRFYNSWGVASAQLRTGKQYGLLNLLETPPFYGYIDNCGLQSESTQSQVSLGARCLLHSTTPNRRSEHPFPDYLRFQSRQQQENKRFVGFVYRQEFEGRIN